MVSCLYQALFMAKMKRFAIVTVKSCFDRLTLNNFKEHYETI